MMGRFGYDPEKRGGGYGWAVLLGGVALYDITAGETLSNAYSRAMNSENTMIRAATIGASAVVALHLLDRLGDYDPIDHLAEAIGDFKQGVGDLLSDEALEVFPDD